MNGVSSRLYWSRSRKHAPTADQIIAARKAAHARGHAPLALAYAIQFEGTNRQSDVMGQWVPLSERVASAVIDGNEKWIGPTWKHVDRHLVLRFMPSKTDQTTQKEVVIDFKACPMVMEELQHFPPEARQGPLIVNPETGLPYLYRRHKNLWRRTDTRKSGKIISGIAVDAGIPNEIWNRDLRAGGSARRYGQRCRGRTSPKLPAMPTSAPRTVTTAPPCTPNNG